MSSRTEISTAAMEERTFKERESDKAGAAIVARAFLRGDRIFGAGRALLRSDGAAQSVAPSRHPLSRPRLGRFDHPLRRRDGGVDAEMRRVEPQRVRRRTERRGGPLRVPG